MLSLTLAAAAGSTPSGSVTIIASAKGTRTVSERKPPHSPPSGKPYIAIGGVVVQLADRPSLQASHSPQ
jgi:hypothetical protein